MSVDPSSRSATDRRVLVASVFVVGLCSIVYELLVSTTSSYFLGDSVRQFSITIGTYMAAMGAGSYLVRYVRGAGPARDLAAFVWVELALGLVGALSVPLLYYYFATHGYGGFQAVMLALVVGIGVLTGLEIPLLTRLLAPHFAGEEALSNVLTLDYLGALAATLLFPFVLLPVVGVFQSSIAFGLVNVLVATYTAFHFRENPRRARQLLLCGAGALALVASLGLSAKLLSAWEDALYRDPIVYTETTPYQTLTVTRSGDDTRLYLDHVIQWSTRDEYRYHESLVHPALLAAATPPRRVLVLGGGEGLAVREILRHRSVREVVVVDIDTAIFRLAREHRQVRAANAGALDDPRVTALARDAFVYVHEATEPFDAIVVDLPDPTTDATARLYSVAFFRQCARLLAAGGTLVTQATGPFHTREAFWCIGATVRAGLAASGGGGGYAVEPYHSYVPAFGDWGFWLARPGGGAGLREPDFPTRYFSARQWALDRHFPSDLDAADVVPNRLDRPVLLDYYLDEWRSWSGEKQVW